ncbi:nicotinamide N-methyltransferase-like [Pleurodeles waltl]|uniref:nicotinamide N-methyltransferase-like n=1 Tax=Pleurodeles waltl TaxID=8319 RepID=UPI0037098ED8
MASGMSLKEMYDKLFDARKLIERYLLRDCEFVDDTLNQLFPAFLKILSSCAAKGGSLIQVSIGPVIHYTIPCSEYFDEITFACLNDKSIDELQKWLKNDPDAMDCSHAIQFFCELQGSSETWIEKQNMIQQKVKHVFECDIDRSDPLSPNVLPKADCLLLVHSLEFLCEDKKTFCDALKNLSSLLKSGGHVIMATVLEATFYMVGDVKFPYLCFNEGFLGDAFTNAGFVIEEHHIYNRKINSLYDITDYRGVMILKACKESYIKCSGT